MKTELLLRIYKTVKVKPKPKIKPVRKHYNIHTYGVKDLDSWASGDIKSFVDHDPKFGILQNVEIVKYPCGAAKGYHYDVTRTTTTGASITYLNDDYLGGNTVIGGVDVQPMMGRTVYFDGCEFRHAVSNILKGDRYTISSWYGVDESLPLNKEFTNL